MALKLLHPTWSGREAIEGRLRDEARMLSLIRHRAIVRVDDLIKLNDAWCVVMEYVEGADLGQLLELGPLPPRVAFQIVEEVASSLHAAYSQAGPEGSPLHLIHRDIKPQNIRLTPQGEVKLLDFGVARAEFGGREASTRTPGMGTIIYMSAERLRGVDRHVGDVYALGVTLFQLLTGVPPGASAADPDRRPPGRELVAEWAALAEMPAALDLILKMMADEPDDRPTAREVARALSELRIEVRGEQLEDWAERIVPGLVRAPDTLAPETGPGRPNSNATLQIGQTVGAAAEVDRPSPSLGTLPEAPPATVPVAAAPRLGRAIGGAAAVLGAALLGAWFARGPELPGSVPAAASAVAPTPGSPATAPPADAGPAVPVVSGAASSDGGAGAATSASGATPVPSTASGSAGASPAPSAGPPGLPAGAPSGAGSTAAGTSAHGAAHGAGGASTNVTAPPAATTPGPAPTAATAAVPAAGTVALSGASSARLSGAAGEGPTGSLPPGTYTATVVFASGETITVPGVRVASGQTTRLKCNESFVTCAVGAPE